jgi:uncharacterized protein (DUF362 family)
MMKRREFFKSSVGAGLAAGAAFSLGGYNKLWASSPQTVAYDLVAVKGGTPDAMFDLGIQALGGMGTFVKKGQTVVLKPNIGWDVLPERAGNTNPALVKRIIEHCFRAGAKAVYVFDNSCDNWVNCYKNSGIEKVAKDAGAIVVPANTESYYQQVSIPKGKTLTSAKVHEKILESDVFINVPVLKNHNSAKMTACMKNMMGSVWDRAFWHRNNLNQCIADYASYEKKPVLNIVDCNYVMVRNGPRGVSKDDLVFMQSQLLSTDWVQADAASAKMMGYEPDQIDYIKIANQMGLGNIIIDPNKTHKITM